LTGKTHTTDPEAVRGIEDPVEQLLAIMALLRDPNKGCPWDREQTLASLKPYLVEETYETLDAIDAGDPDRLRGELGDVLLQIVFQSQIASEAGWFDFAAVAGTLGRKLIRRHPHVFGTDLAQNADEVLDIWESTKRAEGSGLLEGIPRHMPGLQKAHRMTQKAARVGFDWPEVEGVLDKVYEEAGELARADSHEEKVHEMGDLFFALANLARHLDIEPEEALQKANARFKSRFSHVEEGVKAAGKKMKDVPLEELDSLWNEAKSGERTRD
jgi:tetrapyrrole methylase family protein / MazG family protein